MNHAKRSGVARVFAVSALLLSFAVDGASTFAQSASNDLPPGVFMGEPDLKDATAGTYALDPDHAAVIARVSHLRYSYSIFRFDRLAATLAWDPSNIAKSTLTAKVEMASITSNVKGFGEELASENYLKAKSFPEATFTSTAFRPTGPRNGKIDGELALMGKTRPVTFDVELVGAGKGFAGQPRMGVTARTSIKSVDFGLPAILDSIEIVIDAEFQRNP